MNRFNQLFHYLDKTFQLTGHLRRLRDSRVDPTVPTAAVSRTLFLGAALRVGSLLQLESESRRPGWQKAIGYAGVVSDDVLAYTLERYQLEDLRQGIAAVNKQLKRNKALEAAKIDGLLAVSIDGNEQFKSRNRCCDQCSVRRVTVKTSAGEKEEEEFYHRQVYAHIQGPNLSLILDVEPIGRGEEEAQAAVRLLGRLRRLYGPRFFDVVSADAWFLKGPFIQAVKKLGWSVVVVLKQERFELYKESNALASKQPSQSFAHARRHIELRQVTDLNFSQVQGTVRVVTAQEHWQQNRRRGHQTTVQKMETHWRWVADEGLDGYSAKTIWAIGHGRWGIENHAFNELTQHYHLTHCAHHHPTAILAHLLFLVWAFNCFEAFCRLNGKLLRLGKATLQEICRQLDRALERWEEVAPLWSG